MSKQRQSRLAQQPKGAAPAVGPPEPVDFGVWAKALIERLPDDMPDEERAILSGQVHAIAKAPIAVALPPDPTVPQIVRDRKSLKQLAGQIAKADEVVIDLETSSLDPRKGEIVGVGLAIPGGNYYLPITHRFEESGALRPDQLVLDVVVRDLNLSEVTLIAHNAKFELRWLRHHAGITPTFAWDPMIAARLLRSDQPADLKELAMRELDAPDWGLSSADIKRVQFLPVERVARYCSKDCYYTLELYWRQKACLA